MTHTTPSACTLQVEQVTEFMMLPFCERVWLITSLLRSQCPGEGDQPLHQVWPQPIARNQPIARTRYADQLH